MEFPFKVETAYSYDLGNNVLRSDVTTTKGIMQGRAFDSEIVSVDVTFYASNYHRLVFWSFLSQLNRGVGRFKMWLDLGNGLILYTVQITSSIKQTWVSFCKMQISFTVEAEIWQ